MLLVRVLLCAGLLSAVTPFVAAQSVAPRGEADAGKPASAMAWWQRWQRANAEHSYAGTLVQGDGRGHMRSARVWHAVHNGRQIDRIDTLSGEARSIFRTDNVLTVFRPDQKIVRIRDNAAGFAGFLPGQAPLSAGQRTEALRHYQALYLGRERVANQDADVTAFIPQDDYRHAFRFWSEQRTGVLIKWQTLELKPGVRRLADARIVREAAFTDLQVPAALQYATVEQMMRQTAGYAVSRHAVRTVSMEERGWSLRKAVPGYAMTQCYLRSRPSPEAEPVGAGAEAGPPAGGNPAALVHCVLSDGPGNISLFLQQETAVAPPPVRDPRVMARGATRILSQVYAGGYRATAVGEVPVTALQEVLRNLVHTGR